ncbi:hypothetical protein ACQJBY_070915 [Aegilops geniculata]
MATAYNLRSRDEPDDFDEFDSTPYGGGYDLFVTFGRPLPPSDETCYPCSAPSTSYDAPHYAAEEPSPYAHHQKPQPAYGFRPQNEQQQQPSYGREDDDSGYGSKPKPKPQPAYGFRPQAEEEQRPSYGGGGEDDDSGYGSKPQPAYGFRPQQEEQPAYGSKPQRSEEDTYGSGYGRKPQQEEPAYGSGYGSGYGRKPQPRRATDLGTGTRRSRGRATAPATGPSRRWSRPTADRSTALGTEGSRRWRRAMGRCTEAGPRGERSTVALGMAGGRLRRRAMVALGMDLGGRCKGRMKVRTALVGTRSPSLMERRPRVHMVVGTARGTMAARSRMMTLMTRRRTVTRSAMTLMMRRRSVTRSTTTTAATTTTTKHPAWY